ncbi:sodium-dependent transporter [Spirochaeta africana]|uniref:Transporter n=1 Tax=Spirochaeta africana (strain ATCC 700263 / DSM 8902 / Z-7692) TaxID=889378 RepID=H9UHN2_SPIAZ|nr:sodium-dependent transporter [Spirochaeta africana]AFG37025.1 SNF family Na+-dependent transporter [Spirochaeta africana DSM 8902]
MSEATNPNKQRAQWSSEPAFVFSMAAAAVGLGNLWRFPYMVGENGGAAFIIAYLIALAVIALPIMMMEVGAGRLAQGSAVATFRTAHPRIGSMYGWLVVLLTIAITSYYLVITGWTLGYAVRAVSFNLTTFDEFSAGWESLWYFFAVTVLAVLLLIKGVSAIEKLSKLLMPVLLIVILTLVGFATRVDGFAQAREFMFQADLSLLGSGSLWVFAIGQAFYTLAVGQGYLVTYGSYIPEKTHVPRACMVVAGTETAIALLAGFMIFPFVFTFGHDPGEGSQLAFSTLPQVFETMRGGPLLAIAFFLLFFAAAFSSCLAGLKVIIAAIEEEFRLKASQAVLVVGALMLLLGIPSALSFTEVQLTVAGMPFLDFMDQFGGTNVVIASGIIGAGLFCWLVPRIRIHRSLTTTSRGWERVIVRVGRALPVLGILLVIWQIL